MRLHDAADRARHGLDDRPGLGLLLGLLLLLEHGHGERRRPGRPQELLLAHSAAGVASFLGGVPSLLPESTAGCWRRLCGAVAGRPCTPFWDLSACGKGAKKKMSRGGENRGAKRIGSAVHSYTFNFFGERGMLIWATDSIWACVPYGLTGFDMGGASPPILRRLALRRAARIESRGRFAEDSALVCVGARPPPKSI